ncbi:MAG: ABC transporter permease [Armatimonadota bacterium]
MTKVLTIAGKELRSYFVSFMGYWVIFMFLAITGLVFVLQKVIFPGAEADLEGLTGSMVFVLILVTPIVTMRLLAEERRTGTLELLASSPVYAHEIVLGKYLGVLGFYGVMMVLTFQFPLVLMIWGEPDFWPMVVGYLGWLLCGAAFLSVGLLASSLTRDQITAAAVTLMILLVLWLVGFFAGNKTGFTADAYHQLSIYDHLEQFARGVLQAKSVIFFVGLTATFLFATSLVVHFTKGR